jgi:hypothetical protein
MIPKPLHALAALALVGASSAAVAQSAAPLSLAASTATRAGATPADASDLRGPALWIGGAIVLGLIVWGIIELTDDEDDFPVSP